MKHMDSLHDFTEEIEGTFVTLEYSVVAVFFGMIIGTILAIFKVADSKILRIFAGIASKWVRQLH